MITLNDTREIAALKREFESLTMLAEQFPARLDYQKKADVLELKIMELESRGGN